MIVVLTQLALAAGRENILVSYFSSCLSHLCSFNFVTDGRHKRESWQVLMRAIWCWLLINVPDFRLLRFPSRTNKWIKITDSVLAVTTWSSCLQLFQDYFCRLSWNSPRDYRLCVWNLGMWVYVMKKLRRLAHSVTLGVMWDFGSCRHKALPPLRHNEAVLRCLLSMLINHYNGSWAQYPCCTF